MKRLLQISALSIILIGCSTTQQQTAVNTIATAESTATAAVDSYYTLVVQGFLPTNDVPNVSKAYNTFQASVKIAIDATQYNTNALAPSNLLIESQDIINLINRIKGATK